VSGLFEPLTSAATQVMFSHFALVPRASSPVIHSREHPSRFPSLLNFSSCSSNRLLAQAARCRRSIRPTDSDNVLRLCRRAVSDVSGRSGSARVGVRRRAGANALTGRGRERTFCFNIASFPCASSRTPLAANLECQNIATDCCAPDEIALGARVVLIFAGGKLRSLAGRTIPLAPGDPNSHFFLPSRLGWSRRLCPGNFPFPTCVLEGGARVGGRNCVGAQTCEPIAPLTGNFYSGQLLAFEAGPAPGCSSLPVQGSDNRHRLADPLRSFARFPSRLDCCPAPSSWASPPGRETRSRSNSGGKSPHIIFRRW